MAGYIVLRWMREEPSLVDVVRGAMAGEQGWSILADIPGWLIAARAPYPRIRRLPGHRGFVIGDLFRNSFAAVTDELESVRLSERLPTEATARELVGSYWGRYVAVITDPATGGLAVLRDPTGALEAMSWSQGDVTFVASSVPDALPVQARPDRTVDWSVVARWLATGSASAVTSGLKGVMSITPGAVAGLGITPCQVWRPAAFAAMSRSAEDVRAALPELLDGVLRCLTADAHGLLAEVSGGLDSAIAASSLATIAPDKVRQWLNYRAVDGEGDERVYARDVAARWGFALTEAVKPPFALDASLLAATATGLRPGFSGLDPLRDRDIAMRCSDLGVDRVVTGQGGDMVFYQLATPVLARDHLRRLGLRGLMTPYIPALARWTRRSVWSLAATALDPRAAWFAEQLAQGHPWMEGAASLPPGKRAQIVLLTQKLPLNIENLRARQAEILHPLLSQPIMELMLAAPADLLTTGGRDRALAREAFAGRIPTTVAERRGKGELTSYYSRALAAGLPDLRPYLLEGRLAAQGLIDTAQFNQLLTEEHLLWRGEAHVLTTTAVVEAWVRHWS